MARLRITAVLILLGCLASGCARKTELPSAVIQGLLAKYTTVKLTADLSHLSDNQRRMIPLLIEAADAMNEVFWIQAYGDKDALMAGIQDPYLKRIIEINYGPWDRLAGNEPFLPGADPKPLGANYYPSDMTVEEFRTAYPGLANRREALESQYTMVRRTPEGALVAVPYSEAFSEQYGRAAAKLREAAELAEDPGFRRYLILRADALLSDDYQASDLAWMDMKDNQIDIVIGPIESYEDQLFGNKTASEAYVLIKDLEWSQRLERYVSVLPDLQRGLPVPPEYKSEQPGSESQLNAYDVIYYAGDCNAGSKTIAINLPNDEEVQLQKGARRLQLKNAMRAKFDRILKPIAGMLIDPSQRDHVTFDAFFANTMFHEVAHGLGINNTLDGSGTVRTALSDRASALEEGKADVLGLYMIAELHEQGDLGDADLMDYYVTFLGSIFRSIRFGASSAHGIANTIRFNFFQELGAFSRDEATGMYRIEPDRIKAAVDALSERIIRFQGDGDYEGVVAFVEQYGQIGPVLQGDLDRLSTAGIAVDIVFNQGLETLGLSQE
ncbi:MAG: Zn-dependent hydrolase [Candidatus Neomarinimicrobiota bacterium]